MLESIHSEAEQLIQDIRTRAFGFDSRLVEFVTEFAQDSESVQAAVMMSLANRLEDEISEQQQIDDMVSLVRKVEAAHSPERLKSEGARALKSHELVTRRFLSRSGIAFRGTDLSKHYKRSRGRDRGFSLGPVNLTLRRGEITGVAGENGNGKTTLFKLIVGEIHPDSGNREYPLVLKKGGRPDWHEIKHRIAYVPQVLPPVRGDLLYHLQYEAALHGLTGTANEQRVKFIVQRLQLGDHINKRWKDLSGGYQFRFALAKALVWHPEIMVLDEPLANLDPNAQMTVLKDIKAMTTSVSRPIATILSSQHIHEVEAIADNLIFLRQGHVLFNGPISKLGANRDRNVFELRSDASPKRIRFALPPAAAAEVIHDEINTTISCRKDFSAGDLVSALIESGITISYFRDISRSAMAYFREAANS